MNSYLLHNILLYIWSYKPFSVTHFFEKIIFGNLTFFNCHEIVTSRHYMNCLLSIWINIALHYLEVLPLYIKRLEAGLHCMIFRTICQRIHNNLLSKTSGLGIILFRSVNALECILLILISLAIICIYSTCVHYSSHILHHFFIISSLKLPGYKMLSGTWLQYQYMKYKSPLLNYP